MTDVELLTTNFATFVGKVSTVIVIITEVAFGNASCRVWTFALASWTLYVHVS